MLSSMLLHENERLVRRPAAAATGRCLLLCGHLVHVLRHRRLSIRNRNLDACSFSYNIEKHELTRLFFSYE